MHKIQSIDRYERYHPNMEKVKSNLAISTKFTLYTSEELSIIRAATKHAMPQIKISNPTDKKYQFSILEDVRDGFERESEYE